MNNGEELHTSIGDLDCIVHYDYSPPIKASADEEGWGSSVVLGDVMVGGMDILEYLNEGATESLENTIRHTKES